MDANFWHQKWEQNQIPFHESQANPVLVKYFKELALAKGSRVFVPLCGKTLDIPWLLSQGYRAAGAELSKIAIEQLFAELGVEPIVSRVGAVDHYSAESVDILGGDIFEVSSEMLGPVDAIYDRAALVALPEAMRRQYTAHLLAITKRAPQLLATYEYDQSVMDGPPFSISQQEVQRHYSGSYEIALRASTEVPGGLRGCDARENVWLLSNRASGEVYPTA